MPTPVGGKAPDAMCSTGELIAQIDVVRAWKDEEYRLGLSDAQKAVLPAAPAGYVELNDNELDEIWSGRAGTCSCQCSCHCPSLR
jgi:mersacidin/lichenicidin family type 2 lantibiotic